LTPITDWSSASVFLQPLLRVTQQPCKAATMAGEQATSLRRALALLDALGSQEAGAEGGWGVTQLATLVGQDKSRVSRTLQTLADSGYVERDGSSQRYRLGWRVFALAAKAGDRRLLETSRPMLTRLMVGLRERSHLSVLQGSAVLTLVTESPQQAVQTVSWAGRTAPAYCTSSGRALLIDCDEDRLREILAGVRFRPLGPRAPRDVGEMHRRIVAARGRGWAVADEESEPELVSVAAPVRDGSGRVVAALNVSGPKFRMGKQLQTAGATVKSAADEVSAELGWRRLPV